MLPKVPLCLFCAEDGVLGPASGISSLRGEPALLLGESSVLSMLLDRDQRLVREVPGASESGETGPPILASCLLIRRKMWTVSVADETHSKVELRLNDMQLMVDGMVPRRN
jgi:hypothetical protein